MWDPDALPGPFAAVGNTPLAPVVLDSPNQRDVRVHVKLEGLNPSGSVKDRAAAGMIRAKIAEGSLRPGHILLDASSGNMASALAMYGRALGLDVHVVCNQSITADKRQMIEYFGGTVILNDFGPHTHDGYRKCLTLLSQQYCFLDQLHNPENPLAHQVFIAPEILQDLPSVTLIVGSLGSGGTMLGVARAVHSAGHPAMLAAVSSALGGKLPGVGAFSTGEYRTPFIDSVESEGLIRFRPEVTVQSALDSQHSAVAAGLFCGPQTGAVLSAALRLADELNLADDIVVISGDAGWKNWTP